MSKFLPLLLFFILAPSVFAAEVVYEFEQNNLSFTVTFGDGGYKDLNASKTADSVVVSFTTTEDISFETPTLWNSPVKNAWITSNGTSKNFHFSFNGEIITPSINKGVRSIKIDFPLPQQMQTLPPESSVPGIGAYVRMVTGLFVILVIILVSFVIMRYFFRHNIVSDIPGTGRLLGRVDIELKKSIVFYELGEIIYMLSMTDTSITMIDKITDPADVNLIKSGFARRKEFSSYLKFFRKQNEIKEDISNTSDILEEKISSLRKK